MKLTDKYGDLFIEILRKQDMLSLDYLKTQPVKQTLKFFRGFSIMEDTSWSEENKTGMFKLMDAYLRSELASEEIEPTMWLSVIDFTARTGKDDLSDYARDRFFESFEWENLHTDAYQKSKEQKSSSGEGDDSGRGRSTRGRSR